MAREKVAARLRKLMEKAGLPVEMPRIDMGKFKRALQADKKTEAGKSRFVLLEKIGKAGIFTIEKHSNYVN